MSQKYNYNNWYTENATTKTSTQNTFQLLYSDTLANE